MNANNDDLSDVTGERPTWHQQAGCNGLPADWWFPEPSQDSTAAKRVCKTCAVLEQCDTYATANDIRYGIWAGKTPYTRRQNKRIPNLTVIYTNNDLT